MSLYFSDYKVDKFIPINKIQTPVSITLNKDGLYSAFLSINDYIIYGMINNNVEIMPLKKEDIKEKDVILLSIYKQEEKMDEFKERDMKVVASMPNMLLVEKKEYNVKLSSLCSCLLKVKEKQPKINPYAICIKSVGYSKKCSPEYNFDKMDVTTLRTYLSLHKKKFKLTDSKDKLISLAKG